MNGAVWFPLDMPELSAAVAGGGLVRRTVLPSGVRVLTERVPAAASATVGFWVAAGSRDEGPGAHGSTHFLEHLLFKGTRTRTALDIAVSFDEVGGEHNALTGKEYTCYYAKVRDRDVPMAVSVLADMMTGSVLDRDEFEIERGVILEELAAADDDPGDVVGETFFQALFGSHPLGRPIGGTPADIRAVSRDAVWAHYRAAYRPRDLVITVAGAVDHDGLIELVTAELAAAGWDPRAESSPEPRRPAREARPADGSALSVVTRPLEQTHIMLGVPGLALADERRMVLSALNSTLGGGMSSRLFQEIREKRGLAYSVHSFAAAYSDAGAFGLYAACSPARASQVAELLAAEFAELARAGVTEDELRRAKGQLAGASALALEDSDTRMSRLGRAELGTGEFLDLDEVLRRIDLVTPEDVQALAVELVDRPLSLAAVGSVDGGAFASVGLERPAA